MKYSRDLWILLLPVFLSGCAPQVSEILVDYVKSVQEKKQTYVEDLPRFKKFKPFKYTANQFRDPFVPYEVEVKTVTTSTIPDINRKREPLEAYPLETFVMVGTIEQAGLFYALLRDDTGMVHYVGVGNYIGQNSGKIESISLSEIKIQQLGPDNRGGWHTFPVTLYLKKAINSQEKPSKDAP
ncbi:MAG: pilus assembly protein PilP [Gammaproteobacteria bacterium]|nr:pilus assembly protein PilP [Gammaproteobacteria bacterium]